LRQLASGAEQVLEIVEKDQQFLVTDVLPERQSCAE
jgi:hypothetical protein